MRLRHKKNAETDVYNSPIVVGTFSSNNDIHLNNGNAKVCDTKQVFGNNNPTHLELGMGKGRFISELSKKNPNINYIGVEKSATIVLKAVDLLHKGELCEPNLNLRTGELCEPNLLSHHPNLRFMCIDITNLSDVFKPHSIDKIYLNFSDPWPKKRHEIRRLTHKNFLAIYKKLLKPNSVIEFKTDNKDLFDFSLEEIKNSNFTLLEFTYDLHNDDKMNKDNIMTEYEEKFSKLGNKICKLIARS